VGISSETKASCEGSSSEPETTVALLPSFSFVLRLRVGSSSEPENDCRRLPSYSFVLRPRVGSSSNRSSTVALLPSYSYVLKLLAGSSTEPEERLSFTPVCLLCPEDMAIIILQIARLRLRLGVLIAEL